MSTTRDAAAKAAAARREAQHEDTLRALEEERHGYEVRGLDDRVKLVDEQIAAHKKAAPKSRSEAPSATAAPSTPPAPPQAAQPAQEPAKKAPAKKSTARKK